MKKGKYETPATHRKMSKRLIAIFMVMVLAVGAVIGGTLAYLTQKSETYVNTFTYGDINITLEETDTTLDGDGDAHTNLYKMLPGETITKDPIVTVKADSEACWLYVKLEKSENFDQFMTYEMADGWTQLPGYDDVWYMKLDATATDTEYAVIKDNTVTVKPEVTKPMLNALTEETLPSLTVTAYAVQYSATQDALKTAEAAWKQVPQEVATAAELKEALANGGTVTLTENIQVEEQLIISENTTLDLNGKKIEATTALWDASTATYSVICVNGGELTINGNGVVKGLDNDSYAIDVWNGGKLTINGGEFVGNVHSVYVADGELTVNGGRFAVVQPYSGAQPYQFTLNCLDANYRNGTASITVNGGTFFSFNPADCEAEGAGTDFTAAGTTVTQDGDWYTVSK